MRQILYIPTYGKQGCRTRRSSRFDELLWLHHVGMDIGPIQFRYRAACLSTVHRKVGPGDLSKITLAGGRARNGRSQVNPGQEQ